MSDGDMRFHRIDVMGIEFPHRTHCKNEKEIGANDAQKIAFRNRFAIMNSKYFLVALIESS